MAEKEPLPPPVEIPATWLRKEASFTFDAGNRHMTVTFRGGLDLHDTVTPPIAFALIKQAAGQILLWEVQLEKDKLEEGVQLATGQRHKEASAKNLIREGELEIEAIQEARKRKDKSYTPPQMPGFDI